MSDIKYCVTAFIDLLGFAAHLEIGADLRTNIGEQAIFRLNNLSDAMEFVRNEQHNCPEHYPQIFDIKRINDALVITMDLPDHLKPELGHVSRKAISNKHFEEILAQEDNIPAEGEDNMTSMTSKYLKSLKSDTKDLFLFCGLISRIFNYVKHRESTMVFPGPRGTVSTGYRKMYTNPNGEQDYLSANFAFSNAYIAESKLKGTGSSLFFDNNILQLLALDNISKNFLRHSLFVSNDSDFDPVKNYEDPLFLPTNRELKKEIEVELFRKKYIFREINPRLMAFFQIINYIEPYIMELKPFQSLKLFSMILLSLKELKSMDEIKDKPIGILNLLYTDISNDIRIVRDMLVEKDSTFMQQNNGKDLIKAIMFGVPLN
jgi:hypothetical protein